MDKTIPIEEVRTTLAKLISLLGDEYNLLFMVSDLETHETFHIGIGCIRCFAEGLMKHVEEKNIQHETSEIPLTGYTIN